MQIFPSTILQLYKNIPMDSAYNHVLNIGNAVTRDNFFGSLPGNLVLSVNNLSYQRSNRGTILIESTPEALSEVNYLRFQNSAYGVKWFYGFVSAINYINDHTCEIEYTLDYFTTYFLTDIHIKSAYIEREHVRDDNYGHNLIPEDLSIGEDLILKKHLQKSYAPTYAYIFAAEDWDGHSSKLTKVGSYPMGLTHYTSYNVASNADFVEFKSVFDHYVDKGDAESIIAIGMAPGICTNYKSHSAIYTGGGDERIFFVPQLDSIDGYVPKNNKLFNFPYERLALTTYEGNTVELKIENFTSYSGPGGQVGIRVFGELLSAPQVTFYPMDYRNIGQDQGSFLVMKDFPVIISATDQFKTYWANNKGQLAANGVITAIGAAVAVASIIATKGATAPEASSIAAGTSAVAGKIVALSAATTTLNTVASTIGRYADIASQPEKAVGQLNCDGVKLAHDLYRFDIQQYTIKKEFAKQIDDYFTKFGYKVNRLGVPFTNSRRYWNYVKCSDVILSGTAPQAARDVISSVLNRGTTIWHTDFNSFGNYDLNNIIV